VDDFDKQEGKKGARQPQPRKHRECRIPAIQVTMATHTKTARDGQHDHSQGQAVKKTRGDPQPT